MHNFNLCKNIKITIILTVTLSAIIHPAKKTSLYSENLARDIFASICTVDNNNNDEYEVQ